jgi:rhodanese-related sulfurtransferase
MSFFQQPENLLLIVAMLASGAMLLWPLVKSLFSPIKSVGNLNVTQLINHQNALLLDVRETAEYDGGRLPNAVHIPLSQLESRASELAKHKSRPVVAYCATGQRSRGVGGTLSKAGFSEIYHLHGGFRAWKDAGLPVEK